MTQDLGDYQVPSEAGSPEPGEEGVSRRMLLSVGWLTSLFSLAGPALANIRYLFPNVLYETPTVFKLKPPAEYALDSIVFDEANRLFVFHDRHGFRAMSAVCTHLRCIIGDFGPPAGPGQKRTSRCPCHGSVFDTEGRVISGPAPQPLSFFRLSTSPDGRLQVDTREAVGPDTYLKA